MSSSYYSKDFARQFSDECNLYWHAGEYHYGKVLIKTLNDNADQFHITAQNLAEMFFNTGLIGKILVNLKNGNISSAGKLYKTITALTNKFEEYMQEESYTAHFYNERIAMLHSFSELIEAFYNDFNQQVYQQLNTYYSNIQEVGECPVAASSSLSDIIGLTEFYLKNILAYYNYFLVTWQSEVNDGKGLQLTTYMAFYLQSLIAIVEEMIAGIEQTSLLLLEWEWRSWKSRNYIINRLFHAVIIIYARCRQ